MTWDMTLLYNAWHDSLICDTTHWYVTCLIDMWHYSYRWSLMIKSTWVRDIKSCHPWMNGTWLIHMWHGSYILDVSRFCRPLSITHIYVWCNVGDDLYICDLTHWYVTWLIDMWRDSYFWTMRHPSFICDMSDVIVTWLIDIWHDSLICEMTHISRLWCAISQEFVTQSRITHG